MKGLLLGLLLAGSQSQYQLEPHQLADFNHTSDKASDWKLNGELATQCVLATLGDVHSRQGAQLTIHCDTDTDVTGNVLIKLSSTQLQFKRITISADVETGGGLSPTLWIKSLHDSQTMLFDSDAEQMMLNSNGSGTLRTMTAVVARDATSISVGLMLHGKGSVNVHNVHLTVSNDGAVAELAQQVLDNAFEAIKQHSGKQHPARTDVDWVSLKTQAQLFASGANDSADIYPVIRYVLQQLGDQRSMLLTPQTAQLLNQHRSAGQSAAMQSYPLPDGAELVLAVTSVVDRRIADTGLNKVL